jgi:hypothetical protein
MLFHRRPAAAILERTPVAGDGAEMLMLYRSGQNVLDTIGVIDSTRDQSLIGLFRQAICNYLPRGIQKEGECAGAYEFKVNCARTIVTLTSRRFASIRVVL